MKKLKFLLFLSLLSSGVFAQGELNNNLNGHNTPLRISGRKINAIINNPALPLADSNSIITAYATKTYIDNHSGGVGGGAVSSVNGQTGDVVIAIPDISVKLDKSDSALADRITALESHSGEGGSGAVTSVNGQTGDVVISIPDISVKLNKNDSVLANRITALQNALASLTALVGQKQDTSFVDTLSLDYGFVAVNDPNNQQLFLQRNIPNNINPKSLTSYTLDSSDIGKVLTFNNSSGITLTIPAGLRVGFNCTVIQTGTGQVTFTGDGVTIIQSNSYTKTLKQYSVVRLNCFAADTYVLDGEMQ